MKRRAINPIIATLFLIIGAAIIGVAFIGWQQNWFSATARSADVQVVGEILLASGSQQLNLQIKNVGTVKINITKIEVSYSTAPDLTGLSVGGAFEKTGTTLAVNDAIEVEPGAGLLLDPGDVASGYIHTTTDLSLIHI